MRGFLLLAALVAVGCGAEPEAPAPIVQQLARPVPKAVGVKGIEVLPTRAALEAHPSGSAASELAAGAVAVVDLTGRIGVRPRRLWVAKDAEIAGLRWSRWDPRGAVGRGVMRSLQCSPDCARGSQVSAEVVLRLSRPVTCGHGRFFDASAVVVASGGAVERTWLAAPC